MFSLHPCSPTQRGERRSSKSKQEVLGRTNRLLPLIHGPHWKCLQQFFYCCVSISYRGNVCTEPLPSNDRNIFTELLRSNYKGTFTEPLPSNDRGDTQTHTQTATWSHKPILFFFQNKENRLKSIGEFWLNVKMNFYKMNHISYFSIKR
jgi:hypothetical protein